MLKYVIKRILVTIPVLLGVTFIIFSLMFITPGDPARMYLGEEASEEAVYELREEWGLNDSFGERYLSYMKGLAKGDFGISYVTGQPVTKEIISRVPTTAKMALLCIVFSVLIGVPIGILSAIRQYSLIDKLVTVLAMMGISFPTFWLALMLVLLFTVKLGWLPASGLYGPIYYILPVMSISADSISTLARMTRSSMLEVVRQDYMRTARAKGLDDTTIIFKHALRNAMIPILTTVGLQFVSGLSGTVVNEQIFAIPGLGKMMVDAIKARDYNLVQGGVLLIAVMCSIVNLGIDLLYAFVDPRIKSQYSKSKSKEKKAEVEVGA